MHMTFKHTGMASFVKCLFFIMGMIAPQVAASAPLDGKKTTTIRAEISKQKMKRFDWSDTRSASRTARAVPDAVLILYHGQGSYICSPAGFGQRSKCFKR
jgi:hypothetical protein